MSYKLHTPLNPILGFAQLMESDSPPPTQNQAQSMQKILQAGWYLLEPIDEMLDLATIESGQPSLSQEAVPLIEVMRESQAMSESHKEQRGIHIDPRKSSWDDKSPLSACGTTEFSAMQLYPFGTAPQMPKNC